MGGRGVHTDGVCGVAQGTVPGKLPKRADGTCLTGLQGIDSSWRVDELSAFNSMVRARNPPEGLG